GRHESARMGGKRGAQRSGYRQRRAWLRRGRQLRSLIQHSQKYQSRVHDDDVSPFLPRISSARDSAIHRRLDAYLTVHTATRRLAAPVSLPEVESAVTV